MYIFNLILALLIFIILQRIYSAVKNRKRINQENVLMAWENGQKKANDIFRTKSIQHIKKIIHSNILLSIAIKNKNGSKEKNFELAYITLAETVSMDFFIKRVEDTSIPYLYDKKEINKYVKKKVFSIFRENKELEKEFQLSLVNKNVKDEYKKDIYEIISFITEIAKEEKK